MSEVHVVVPADIDDAAVPSGGNAYDRRICDGLAAIGWAVHELAVVGAWPRPDAAARGCLARALAAVPDGAVVLLDGLVACGVPDVLVPAARRLTLVVLVHLPLGDEAGPAPAAAAELAALERETLHGARAVVATSPWVARRLVARHGVPADRVHIVMPGVDPAPLAAGTDGATRLLCVGSVTPTKGQDLLVEALAAVGDTAGPRLRCDLVGPLHRDPAYAAAVRRAIERHGLGGRVRITGPFTTARLEAVYAAADLLVLPSRVEAYGMVVTEALARGIPVLAAGVGGVLETLGRDLHGRVPGIVVPPADVVALAAALRRWLGEPALREGLRHTARARRGTLDGWEMTSRCLAGVLARLPG
ncbi:glycosyltransferase family 4 protein [Pseudonocardia asaccharolytica]|uniref:Glycosyl transferase n=1 Tax=Pseudonocardia asaccharolytica DSM 44247 = NBRC 16224 TaxID=1123024 RepID=A0A511D359_9PSEU|nr:glycosyltransferase family 4 protein [Pseudonocardia asaccharolytica]GEL19215.1 glycosyl transferase [Pseudonocardia asaccharolytica DSM 44247 = NBRC 16224]